MIHILLTTLKVIGILLAITLGLIVGLILIVLFVPIRYNANVNNIDVKAKVTWLLHLLSVRLEFIDKKLKYKIKILGITILNSEKPKKPKKTKETKEVEAKKQEEPKTEPDVKKEPEVKKKLENKQEAQVKETSHAKNRTETKEKKSISQKLLEVINNIKFKIKNICDKIKNVLKKITDYKDFLTTEESITNIKSILKMLLDLLLYVLPTKLKGNVKFGFDNPETTGKALGAICIFHGVYADNITLEPDFDNKVFEANVKLKGRIRLYRFVVLAFKLWRNKWIKKLLKFIKKH